jgi:hypothetical protein
MTDTSLVGRVLAIFGRGFGIRLYRHLELLARPQKISTKKSRTIIPKITEKKCEFPNYLAPFFPRYLA